MVRTKTQRMSVVGVFHNLHEAQAAVRDLKAAGFRDDEIGVMGPGEHGDVGHTTTESADGGTHAAEGAVAGAATGAGVGALWAVGIAAGVLPAIGPVVAGGILASILASAAGGAAAAGLAGALIGMGIPEEEATYYENEFRSGRTIVTVKTTDRQDEARRILGRHSGFDMESRPDRASGMRSTTTAPTMTKGTTKSQAVTNDPACHTGKARTGSRTDLGNENIELREEQLHAEKNVKKAGEVRVHKDVVTEHKSIDVPVTREEVVIERRPAHGKAASGKVASEQNIRIPIKEEEVRVTKTPVVKEEVSVGKKKVTDTKRVEADVRREELRVDETGDVRADVSGTRGRTKKNR